MGPINQQLSLDEAYIILGIEGGAQLDDTAVILAYNELVRVLLYTANEVSIATGTN